MASSRTQAVVASVCFCLVALLTGTAPKARADNIVSTIDLNFMNTTGVTVYDLNLAFSGTGGALSFATNTVATITKNSKAIPTFTIPVAQPGNIVVNWPVPPANPNGFANGEAIGLKFTFTLPQAVTFSSATWSDVNGKTILGADGKPLPATPTPEPATGFLVLAGLGLVTLTAYKKAQVA